MPKKSGPPILKAIEELYEKERKRITPLYPVNKKTGKIELPEDVIADLKFFLLAACRRVTPWRHFEAKKSQFEPRRR